MLSESKIHGSAGEGIVVAASTCTIRDTTVEGSAGRGVWLQDIASGAVKLDKVRVKGSSLAGIGMTKAKGVTLEGCEVSGVTKVLVLMATPAKVGDGLQILDGSEATVRSIAIDGAERAGLLVDSAKATVKDSTISGDEGALLVQKAPIVGSDYANNQDGQGKAVAPQAPKADLVVNTKPLPGTMPVPLP